MEKQWVNISEVLFFQEGPGVRNTQYTTKGVKLLNVANLVDGKIDLSTSDRYIGEEDAYGKYKHFLCEAGDFVVASSGIKVEYIDKKMGFIDESMLPLCMNTSTIRFKVLNQKQLNIRYFMYYLKSRHFKEQLARYITGSAQLNYGPSHLNKMIMPLIPICEQIELINRLDKIQSMIDMRQRQLEKLDDLVKARFVELFGNFVYEHGRWSTCEIGDVADTIDPQPSHRTPPVSSDGVPYIGIAECNYKTLQIDFANARKVGRDVLQEHLNRYTLNKGDFIIGKIGTIGKPFFLPDKQTYTLSANTVLIKPNKQKVEPQFLFAVFQSEYMERIIDAEKKSTSQPAFGIQKVRKINIPMPPMELQKQFAAFVEQTDKSKVAIQKALDEAQLLFDSLIQKYFE